MATVLVTGANGFVGRAAVDALAKAGFHVRASVRTPAAGAGLPPPVACCVTGELSGSTDWTNALRGVSVIVHSAARVHVMRDTEPDPLAAFRRVNVEATAALARQAARAGVRRVVLVSSVKVNGEITPDPEKPFTGADAPNPSDPYGVSKMEGEDALRAAGREAGLETVCVRPVLVYGPGVRANFLNLLRMVDRGIPLPFGATRNLRSMTAGANLADLLVRCCTHPRAAGRTFMAADREPYSTGEWVRRIALALGRPARLVPVPPAIFKACCKLIGKPGLHDRLFESLVVSTAEAKKLLEWSPPFSTGDSLAETAAWFRREKEKK